jgi:hypothetical protein
MIPGNIKTKNKTLGILLAILALGCGSNRALFRPTPPVPDDRTHVPQPRVQDINTYADYFYRQVRLQVRQSLDVTRQWRNLSGNRPEALNTDAFDEVPNSSWFHNRNHHSRMSIEGIIRGPNTCTGPDTSAPWIITRAKAEGVTPGFTIKDRNGNYFVIKFDPPGYPELASGAEVVSTKLFYAAGYHVPENYIVTFQPDILRMGEDVKLTDEKGRRRTMTIRDLKNILNNIQKKQNGDIRALASRYLQGYPVGPFRYDGLREDDHNDFIPHEHRRELRGLYIIAGWLNHFDTKDNNSLDMYVTESGRSFVRHYLIDFGGTLGSASKGPNVRWRGYRHDTDPIRIAQNIVRNAVAVRDWEMQPGVRFPSIGVFESSLFDPLEYKSQVPNPAFENMTDRDGFWAARIVMSFTDDQIRAAVSAGHYSDPAAAEYLAQTLIERRDIIGRTFFKRMPPLDDFKLKMNPRGIEWIDLGIQNGLWSRETTDYQYRVIRLPEGKVVQEGEIDGEQRLFLPLDSSLPLLRHDTEPCKQLAISLQLRRNHKAAWSRSVRVYVEWDKTSNKPTIIGLDRSS